MFCVVAACTSTRFQAESLAACLSLGCLGCGRSVCSRCCSNCCCCQLGSRANGSWNRLKFTGRTRGLIGVRVPSMGCAQCFSLSHVCAEGIGVREPTFHRKVAAAVAVAAVAAAVAAATAATTAVDEAGRSCVFWRIIRQTVRCRFSTCSSDLELQCAACCCARQSLSSQRALRLAVLTVTGKRSVIFQSQT